MPTPFETAAEIVRPVTQPTAKRVEFGVDDADRTYTVPGENYGFAFMFDYVIERGRAEVIGCTVIGDGQRAPLSLVVFSFDELQEIGAEIDAELQEQAARRRRDEKFERYVRTTVELHQLKASR